MKTVYLVRHAKSSWSDPELSDIDRPLNNRGRRDAPFMAKLLKGKGLGPDRLVSSPAKRAFKTATFFAKALDIPREDIIIEQGIYEAGTQEIVQIIRDLDDKWSTILLFGHNPTFTYVANLFTKKYISNIPTCGIVRIEAPVDSWKSFSEKNATLREFYYPKQYFH